MLKAIAAGNEMLPQKAATAVKKEMNLSGRGRNFYIQYLNVGIDNPMLIGNNHKFYAGFTTPVLDQEE